MAEEALLTARLMGQDPTLIADVGVAGLHRLLARLPEIREAKVIVVVAGMDAALPSVLAGLVSAPVIAVPTSAGYGASFDGLAALLAMLNSCAPGVAVVNIDNGFGAGYLAAQINRRAAPSSEQIEGASPHSVNRRVGCLILALLFALLFIFWGMMCPPRFAQFSPEEPAAQSVARFHYRGALRTPQRA